MVLAVVLSIFLTNSFLQIRARFSWLCNVLSIISLIIASRVFAVDTLAVSGGMNFVMAVYALLIWQGKGHNEKMLRLTWLDNRQLEVSIKRDFVARSTLREGKNSLNFAGRYSPQQKWFIASFPGMYEEEWKDMVEGGALLPLEQQISVACVFYSDGNSQLAGVHMTAFSALVGPSSPSRFWRSPP